MTSRSPRFLVLALAWMITCSAFTPHHPAKTRFQTYYYFYDYPADTFDNYDYPADEVNTWANLLGVPVNTSSAGGTLILKGYGNNNDPHNLLPSVFLYAHY